MIALNINPYAKVRMNIVLTKYFKMCYGYYPYYVASIKRWKEKKNICAYIRLNKPTVKSKINNGIFVSLIATRFYISLSGKCIDLENIEPQRTSFFFNTVRCIRDIYNATRFT